MTEARYVARSASNHTDAWAYWYVADSSNGNLNVIVGLLPQMSGYMPFLSRRGAERVAASANEQRGQRGGSSFSLRTARQDGECRSTPSAGGDRYLRDCAAGIVHD